MTLIKMRHYSKFYKVSIMFSGRLVLNGNKVKYFCYLKPIGRYSYSVEDSK